MPQRLKSGTCQYSRLITHPPRERMKERFVFRDIVNNYDFFPVVEYTINGSTMYRSSSFAPLIRTNDDEFVKNNY